MSDFFSRIKDKLKNKGQAYLRVKAIPGAPRTEIKGEMADGTIKIALNAPAEKGRANKELLYFLAREAGIAKNGATIVAGASSRIKLIKIKKT
jgi:uncharacterized protein